MNIANEKNDFIISFSDKIINNEAAVFIGAGCSVAAGMPNWNNFVNNQLKEMNIDSADCSDVMQAAQFYENENGREKVKTLIKDVFSVESPINQVFSYLVKLPIHLYWTTNYDELIEKTFIENNKKITVKACNKDLTKEVFDNVLYKMHGDINHLDDVVLTKNDYERYDVEKSLFRDALKSCLMSHTFLFYGFSFSDPNLDFILSRMNILLQDDSRIHYCITEKAKDDKKAIVQQLKIKDLEKRYKIKTILIDKYGCDDREIFVNINKRVRRNSVFISGSHVLNSEDSERKYLEELSFRLADQLVKKSYKITSGFGVGIGSSVINGAMTAIKKDKDKTISNYLNLKPFPQNIIDEKERKSKFTDYRKEMISETGVSIFISGCKTDCSGKTVISDGCKEEFEISRNNGNIIIPIASTGNAAEEIFHEIEKNIGQYSYLKGYLSLLKNENDIDKIIEIILQIIEDNRNGSKK